MFSAILARLQPRSIRSRLQVYYLLTLGGSLLLFAALVVSARARTIYQELDADLETRGHSLVDEMRPSLLQLDLAQTLAGDGQFRAVPFAVRDGAGQLVFHSDSFPDFGWSEERQAASSARQNEPLLWLRDRSGQLIRLATLRVSRPGADPVVLQIAEPVAPIWRLIGQSGLWMLLAIGLILMVASYGSSFTARRALSPVDAIVARTRHIQATSLSGRLEIDARSEELDLLVVTLNAMLDRIEASVKSARRFAADASHELQTPVAGMRSAVELLLRDDCGPARTRGVADDLVVEIDRLSELIRDLRLLALADAGRLIDTTQPVDLIKLTNECAELARAMAEEKQIQVDAEFTGRAVVTGSALHLRRLILNLVQNAIRYSPPDSSIVLEVHPSGHEAVLTVQDHGCGIASEDLPHIFEPFYRADPARARETGGSGLGLAIADQIVRAHGGRIQVVSRLGDGSTFAIHFPLLD
jgi:two-component system, OmpR family, sensor kinase